MRIAIAGLGTAATHAHLPALLRAARTQDLRVVGLCDPLPKRWDSARRLAPEAATYADCGQMLDVTAPDLLVIASPPSAHMAAVREAAARNIDIVCEKPLGLRPDDVAELDVLRQGGLLVATVLQYRHARGWMTLAQRIENAISRGENVHVRIEVERPGTDPLSVDGWRSRPDEEGGVLGDHAVHHLSLLREVLPDVAIASCLREGTGGAEAAFVDLAGSGATASIHVTYMGRRRANRVRVEFSDGVALWDDDRLVLNDAIHTVESLSDRSFVNALYAPWYAELLRGIASPSERNRRGDETIGVARLLQSAIAGAADPGTVPRVATEAQPAWLNTVARAVLLAFADLGVYLPSQRERLLGKIRGLDLLKAGELETFLDLCIAAELITPERAGRLRLAPAEAKRLAQSLEGASPVPDVQALAWAHRVGALAGG